MNSCISWQMTNHSGATPISEAAPNHFLGSTETPCPPKVSRRPLPGSPQPIPPAFKLGGRIPRVTSRVSPRAMRLLTPILDPLCTHSTGDGSHSPSCSRTTVCMYHKHMRITLTTVFDEFRYAIRPKLLRKYFDSDFSTWEIW